MAEKDCALLDHFAILIQLLLGAIAFSTLILKRQLERPRRPVRIWAFDVSKQVVGALLIHSLNVLASLIAGSVSKDTNPCIWYFLNIFVDCTLGVFILFLVLKAINTLLAKMGVRGIKSGEYGNPPRWTWWIKQTLSFVFCLALMKVIVLLLFRLCPFLFDFGEWILGWSLHDTRLQVVFVMLIFPLIMNIVQFWLVDQVIKKRFEGVKLDDSDGYGNEDDAFLGRKSIESDESARKRSTSVSENQVHVAMEALRSNNSEDGMGEVELKAADSGRDSDENKA
ncbi:1603_t:CDS:2 [Paraglomus brasilianum]|uniref:1603_t:CDS:1 n=1 Tax=Paraglomus brasilianum TaxID=144538 RepID=A0A9N9CJK6_9GLOM|nr:1603_t:CDS:2 [Paraglomus brasilianum]